MSKNLFLSFGLSLCSLLITHSLDSPTVHDDMIVRQLGICPPRTFVQSKQPIEPSRV
jgi:hypothetical protein